MKKVTLEEIIQQALTFMQNLGVGESHLVSFKNWHCRNIQKYYDVSGETMFNKDLLDCYQKYQENRMKCGLIGSNYYTVLIRAVKMLIEVYQTGTLQWRVYGAASKFKID